MPAGAIAEQLALAPSGLSFHEKKLTAAGLLLIRKPDGWQVRYSAGYTTMNDLIGYLAVNCCQGEACALECHIGCQTRTPPAPHA